MALDKLIQTRCSEELRERAEQAAWECELSLGEWLRAVVEGAVSAHFADTSDAEPAEPPADPTEEPEDYIERVEAEAAELRQAEPPLFTATQHPGLHESGPEPPNPRDCPHLPQWRVGALCAKGAGGCGRNIGGRNPARIPTRTTRAM